MGVRIEFTPKQRAEICRRYARTATPVRDIAALMGVSRQTIVKYARLWRLPPRKPQPRPLAQRRAARDRAGTGPWPDSPARGAIPRDIDELRLQLARRLRALNDAGRRRAPTDLERKSAGPA